jgi:hypothetical protein
VSGVLILSIFLPLSSSVASAASTPVNVGYRDFHFGSTANATPTGEKPESKLWFNDGSWWGVLWDPVANSYAIHRFDVPSQNWTSTGTIADARTSAKVDVLWDGQRLYVASHVFTMLGAPTTTSNSGRLYRYSYNAASDSYSLDAGFPVTLNSSKSETLVLDKDSTGKLWVTWVEGGKVKVNRTVGDDLTWGQPFNLPGQGDSTATDDISSVVAFGNKIGVMWSNQTDKKMYFAVHVDGNGDTSWQPREEALADASLGSVADDHISLKPSCASDGSLYAVTKTSLTSPPEAPLNYVLKRSATGTWSRHVMGTVAENHTRAILLVDATASRVHVLSQSNITGRLIIYMKSASMSDLVFPSGLGTPFIDSSSDPTANNPTSTKQCVTGSTGLLVLASDQNTRYYLHNFLPLGGLAPAITSFSPTSGPVGVEVTITGARFSGATNVAFNGTPAPGFVVDSSTQIRARVPAGASTGRITVTTSTGTGTSATDFVVLVPPTITSFTPTSGPVGTVVTISGRGFTGTTAVAFNGVTASFTVVSDAQLRATVPSGAATGRIRVTNGAGSVESGSVFTVTTAGTPVASISDVTVIEGNVGTVNAVFAVTLSSTSSQAVTVSFATANGTAVAPNDYASHSGTLTFPAGTTSQSITVPVNGDLLDEPDETFFVNLANATNATISDGQGVGTIRDDDETRPALSISDVTVAEGNVGTVNAVFAVTLSSSSSQAVTVSFATANGTAVAPNDYASHSGTLTFPAGTTSQSITVPVNGDLLDEPDETFFVNLANATNATISDGQGVGTIRDDDETRPALSIDDVTVTEGTLLGASAVFTVRLSTASGQAVTVSFATANGTAVAPNDYASHSGTLTFPAGTASLRIAVRVVGDLSDEPDETFFVNLANATNATISDGQGVGTIRDDDLPLLFRENPVPREFALRQIYPNPLRTRTTIRFELPRSGAASLIVFDAMGRAVRTLVDGDLPAGVHEVPWDARNNAGDRVSSGIYLVRFQTQDFASTRKLVLRR